MNIRPKIWLPVIVVMLDAGAVVLGAWLAYLFRFSGTVTTIFPTFESLPPILWYLRLSFVLAGLVILSFLVGGLYRFPRREGLFDELVSVFKLFLLAWILLLAVLFFYRGFTFSRLTMAFLAVSGGGFLGIVRIIGRWLREELYTLGMVVKRAAVVGGGEQADPIVRHLLEHPEFGLRIIGCITSSDKSESSESVGELKELGSIQNAGQTVKDYRLDTLIITPTAKDTLIIPQLVRSCYGINVDFLYLPEISTTNGRPKRVIDVGGVPLWTLKENPFEGWMGVVKRTFDIIVSLALLILVAPVMIIIALTVKLNSKGPLLYRQRRIGRDGREFNCLKFRSMKVDAENETGPVWAIANDTRTTRVGRFLRRWSLDELPQLFNVITGEMSLVGPRPERPEFVHQFEKRIDGYHERHRVRAGLTGWAQVNGLRGDTPIEDRTIYDRYYVENWSLLFDLKIMLMTARAVIKGDNPH
ncbi:MAG: undecaprenyl-phosphate glucose phosphotransferase [Calditrichaeota bacterium]|nr:undecaprenyl-phosphate glucose phosphotransferase [Calditrichota bacterium]